jgi:capsular polysaccharide biosynthesis protein
MEIFELRKGYSYLRDLPVNYRQEDALRFDPIRKCAVSRAFIERVDLVKVCQYYIFSDQKLLEDFCLPIQLRGKQQVLKQWLKTQLFPKIRVDEAIWVIDLWSENYFHWILECLPRILALRSAGINLPLLLPEHLYKIPYIRDSLFDLNIQTFTYNFRQTVKVNRLFMPSHDSPCAFDRDYLKNLVDTYHTIDPPQVSGPSRKIYISRKDAGKRKVANEAELIPVLKEAGFECIQLEKLSFKAQRELMRETAVLLSVHGAGLANLIFMQRESKIVELHPDVDRYNSCFYHLASAIDMKYYYSFELGNNLNPQHANISIDIPRFKKMISSL